MAVSKNRGVSPKMDGYKGKPYFLMDDLGGFPPIFGGSTPTWSDENPVRKVCDLQQRALLTVQLGTSPWKMNGERKLKITQLKMENHLNQTSIFGGFHLKFSGYRGIWLCNLELHRGKLTAKGSSKSPSSSKPPFFGFHVHFQGTTCNICPHKTPLLLSREIVPNFPQLGFLSSLGNYFDYCTSWCLEGS